ncbi:(Fe-S)-binding protein [Lederbergia graminis]|uniref:Lactate utilization protein A n=1 Tax=Lederbergia graminis TaxID=735518 RepID=A0ABW0LPL6_9BACI|nr:(Fe-S)-binding protein [Paenibacillus bovis]HLU22734.1 (Fe-S)-binding protein [Bacillaceae bacterium]
MKVSLFITCLADVFYPQVGKDVVEILERYGCEVDFPTAQTCCGQPAYNSGYHQNTKAVAKHMINTFLEADYVVSPSGSCVLMVHEYVHLFQDEEDWRIKAQKLADKTYEFTQFLHDVLQIQDVGANFPEKVTYHCSCHMTRLLGVKEAPIKLLEQVQGLEFVELPNKEICCGFGGTFSVKMVPISEQMVDEKISHIEETGADVLVGSDCGCLMNIAGRKDRIGKQFKVMHIAQILNSTKSGE